MCGIAGYISPSREFSPELLREMCRSIVHRGPDDQGEFHDREVALAIRRLSIIDLETGHQPIFNEDGSVVTVCNGEIYNFRELRDDLIRAGHHFKTRSDIEVIVHLYEEFGPEFVSKLEGMFAFALWDTRRRLLILGRDRFGMKPLFVATTKNNSLIFCSELKGILLEPAVSGDIDLQALDLYLAYQYVPSPRTIYSAIKKIPPAHIVLISDHGSVEYKRYWRIDNSSDALSSADYLEEIERLMKNAVRKHLISDVPLGVFLSGGIDSGLIATLMASESQDTVRTFTVRFLGEKGGVRDESELASTVAERIGAEHRVLTVRPDFPEIADLLTQALEEPFSDDSIIPSYYLCRETREHVKVALSGLGGDELFAGYRRHLGHTVADSYNRFVPRAADGLIRYLVSCGKESASSGNARDQIRRFLQSARLTDERRYAAMMMAISIQDRRKLYRQELVDDCAFSDTDEYMHGIYNSSPKKDALSRALFVDMSSYLCDDVLMLTDRISMMHSLEVRVPFLDRELVEAVWAVPSGKKIRHLSQKRLLRQIAAKWLPKEILNQPKQGFESPMSAWLRGPLEPYCREILNETDIRRQGFFNFDYVNELIDTHTSGRKRNNKILFSLIMFQNWINAQSNCRSRA